MFFYSILSGFLGAIIGSYTAYYLYRINETNSAKFEFSDHINHMIHKFRFGKEDYTVFDVFNDNYVSLSTKYFKLRTFTWPCKRERLRKAWVKCMEQNEETSKPGIPYGKFPETEDEAMEKLSELLEIIEKI